MNRWANRVALVTGSSTEIGKALCNTLVKHGMKVVACAKNLELADNGISLVHETTSVIKINCDVSKEEHVTAMFEKIKKKLGGVDVCVNYTGLSHDAPLLSGSVEKWREMLEVNVLGMCICSREAVKSMMERGVGDGHIIQLNSDVGHDQCAQGPCSHFFDASNVAVTSLTDGLCKELKGTNIRVTRVSAGLTETEFDQRLLAQDPQRAIQKQRHAELAEVIVDGIIYALNAPEHIKSIATIPAGGEDQRQDVSYRWTASSSDKDIDLDPVYNLGHDVCGEVIEEVSDGKKATKRCLKVNQQLGTRIQKTPGSVVPMGALLKCIYCSFTSHRRYLMLQHMESHKKERPHKCAHCDRRFKTSSALQDHVNAHTGIRPNKCNLCKSAFTTSGDLVRHLRYKHTHEKPHKCMECDFATVERSKLRVHLRSHTGERPYKCSHCSYAAQDSFNLKRHLRIHTGEKPYECDICQAKFTQSNSLKAHKLIHSGTKPVFQCPMCPSTLGRKVDLKTHMQKLHSGSKPLICKHCKQSCPDRYSYKVHALSHKSKKGFKCSECDHTAVSKRHLKTHMLSHSTRNSFENSDCNIVIQFHPATEMPENPSQYQNCFTSEQKQH